jgi:hypothetical protein
MGLDTKTYWLTDCQSQCDFDFVRSKDFTYVYACSNTFTVALPVDEKGTQFLGNNWATLFLGDVNTGTWLSRFWESRIWETQIWLWFP